MESSGVCAVGRSVEEYGAFYREGKGLPSEVMTRSLKAIHDWEKDGYVIFSTIPDDVVLAHPHARDEGLNID